MREKCRTVANHWCFAAIANADVKLPLINSAIHGSTVYTTHSIFQSCQFYQIRSRTSYYSYDVSQFHNIAHFSPQPTSLHLHQPYFYPYRYLSYHLLQPSFTPVVSYPYPPLSHILKGTTLCRILILWWAFSWTIATSRIVGQIPTTSKSSTLEVGVSVVRWRIWREEYEVSMRYGGG